MRLTPETREQIALFDWLKLTPELFAVSFHIPNEGKRNARTGYILKRMGLKPGASDVFIAKASRGFHGLFIELKALTQNGVYGKPTASQMMFVENMQAQNYCAEVCNGADEAIELIKWYFQKTSDKPVLQKRPTELQLERMRLEQKARKTVEWVPKKYLMK